MREISFRGKRQYTGEWAESVCPLGVMHSGHLCDDFDPSTVGQYTGLKDKNGKRIFEGDVCRNARTGEIVSVNWHGTMAGFVWNRPKKDGTYLHDFGELFRAYDKYEVIGNIHDNTELLDGGDGNG